MPQTLPSFLTNTALDPSFESDVLDTHLVYDYAAQSADGKPEKWRYEIWFISASRVVYAIHGGPMAGRRNYQEATYQCVRPGELWQVNWLEETGTICSLAWDIPAGKVTTLIAFSRGHWENPVEAHGDKRHTADFERWRGLAKIGTQVERYMLSEQGEVVDRFKGKGNLETIREEDPTF